ncbi:MAG: TonB-dependent receptor [Acidobacteriota bacterium]
MAKGTGIGAALLLGGLWAAAQQPSRLLENYQTEITVYGERLPGEERQILDTAAPVVVLSREAIEASGAGTLQEILSQLPGVTLHNQTGNDAESTVDVRGFPQGTSLAVFLDGVRLNDLQDNAVRWDLIPIGDVERIEVYSGAAAPLYGGGALAGVVNVITRRRPGFPRLDLTTGGGSFGAWETLVRASGSRGPVEFYAAGSRRAEQGWRQNDGHRLDDGILRLNAAPLDGHEVSLLLKYAGGAQSAPGALTAEELKRDREQSPFNLYDGTRGRHRLASLGYRGRWSGWSVAGQAYGRFHDRDTLTTGRFGSGFLTSGRERLRGGAAQASRSWSRGEAAFSFSGGAELSRGAFEGRGFFTDVFGKDPSPASDTRTRQRSEGIYAQGEAARGAWQVLCGVRTDRARYAYTDRRAPSNNVRRTFRETTWRAGLLYRTGEASSAFLTRSQGYRIPSVVDLFAYPGFSSNPDLESTRSSDWEAGWRYLSQGRRFKVTLYRMEMRDEVVFVLTNPQWFIGQNRNVGRSFRRGVEAEVEWPLPAGFRAFASGSYQDAEVTAGPHAGRRLPMVPRAQGTAGLQWNGGEWTVRLAASWVGPQLLDNDLANRRASLPGYTAADLSARWTHRALTVEAGAFNLLDKAYSGRGITNGATDYFTPSAPRSFRLALTWSL